jgi:hypothetical protein
MANVKKFDDKVIIQCPDCNKWRDSSCFRGNPNPMSKGWWASCVYCRAKDSLAQKLEKPQHADWDGVAGECGRCGGTGVYQGVSGINNQVITKGVCYRCVGKGKQTWRDRARNMSYDEYCANAAMRADIEYTPEKEEEELRDAEQSAFEHKHDLDDEFDASGIPREGGEFTLRSLFNSDEEYQEYLKSVA